MAKEINFMAMYVLCCVYNTFFGIRLLFSYARDVLFAKNL